MTTAQFPNSSGSDRLSGDGGAALQGADNQDQGVKEQAQQVAGSAAQEGKRVAGTAKDEAAKVASEATSQARTLLSEATTQLDEQTTAQKDRLSETVRTFSDDLENMASQGGGLAAEVAKEVAERARSLSAQLESKNPRDLLDDVRHFARRKPGTFLLGALAAGIVAGRLTRGVKDAQSASTERSVTLPGTRPAAARPSVVPTYGSPGVATPVGTPVGRPPSSAPGTGSTPPVPDDPMFDRPGGTGGSQVGTSEGIGTSSDPLRPGSQP